MDRRNFFRLLAGAAGAIALEEAIPFGRVWSFPSKIVVPKLTMPCGYPDYDWYFDKKFAVGGIIQVRIPQRFTVDGWKTCFTIADDGTTTPAALPVVLP
jgi:hypothetical protein